MSKPVKSGPVRRFVGQNIKGNPKMTRKQVAHDLRVVQKHSDVYVLQEFHWASYWRILGRSTAAALSAWASFPPAAAGLASPTVGGQPIGWKRGDFVRLGARKKLLHRGVRKVSETRYLRAVHLAESLDDLLRCWFATTHFVVGGDDQRDSPRRKQILAADLDAFEGFIRGLLATGDPVVVEIDGNIHRGTWAYARLLAIVQSHRGTVIGTRGVEYLIVFPGTATDTTQVEVIHDFQIPTSELFTDHEGRGMLFRLQRREEVQP